MKQVVKPLIFIITLALYFAFIPCQGQEKRNDLKQLTSLEGLGGESVFKIYRDKNDMVWLGTNSGVSCYNGHTLINLATESDNKRNIVNTIQETPDGNLFIGMRSGLFRVDKRTMTCRRVNNEIDEVNALCLIGDTLLAGGDRGLWALTKEGNAEVIPIENSIISKGNAVNDMAPDGKGGAWISTNTRLAHFKFNGRKIEKFDIDKSILTGNLGRICLVGNTIYIGTKNSGLLKYDITSGKTTPYIDVRTKVIADLNTDGKGLLYISTDGSGAYVIDVQKDSIIAEYSTALNNLPSDGVYTFWYDKEYGINWFGFYLEGFCHNYHLTPKFHIYKYKDFDSSQLSVRSFCIHDGIKVIGTRNGLYLVDERRDIIKYYDAGQIGGSIVTNIKYFNGHFVIANYERGLSILNPADLSLRHLDSHEVLRSGNFSRLCTSPGGTVLFAISNMGVVVLDKDFNVAKHFNSRNSELPDTYLTDILFDKSGKAWISSVSYMSVYDPLLHTIQASGFPKDFFNQEPLLRFNLCGNGDVIAFSETSVYRSQPDFSHFEKLDIYDRLNIKNIAFISEYDHKYWVGTGEGLFLFDSLFHNYLHFSESDNLPSLRFNMQEYQRTPDGTLWFGNGNGLIYVTPEQQANMAGKEKGHVVIDRLFINGISAGETAALMMNEEKGASISWNFRSEELSAIPILLNYSRDRGRYYEWSLDGGEYTSCADGEKISVSDLSLGRHTLKIRLTGHEETASTFTVSVFPSWLFYAEIILFLCLLFSAYKALRIGMRREKLRKALRSKHKIETTMAAEKAVAKYIEEEQKRQKEAEEARMLDMYKRSRLSDEECRSLYKKVKKFVEETKAYTNPALRIGDIANAIESTPNKLSQMFNQYARMNFADFINSYRISEFKRKVADKKYNQYTVIALAEMCGLKKSAFFAAFKKIEGCTPLEYITRNGIER